MFRNLSIGAKIYGVAALGLLGILLVASVALINMARIGGEIVGIAERDLPLTEAITRVTMHQLGQSVLFERSLLLAGEGDLDAARSAASEFVALDRKVDAEILEGLALAVGALEEASYEGERQTFEKVLSALTGIKTEHDDYGAAAAGLIEEVVQGAERPSLDRIHAVEKQQDALDRKLEGLLSEIAQFSLAAAATAEEHEKTAEVLIALISSIIFILCSGCAFLVVRTQIVGPLAQVVDALGALAAGDVSVAVTARNNDEIGRVATALETLRETTRRAKELSAQVEKDRRAREERQETIDRLTVEFGQRSSERLQAVAECTSQLDGTANAMSGIAADSKAQMSSAAAATEEASGNVATVAAATEELFASIEEISRQVDHANVVVQDAVRETERTNATVSELVELANRVGEVVNLIQAIAEQTNLLALNATIEAARAGDAGKGFAVVASEVKALANQTTSATEEIGSQIAAIQEVSGSAAGTLESISQVINRVQEVSASIASAVEEQRTATSEISRNVQEASLGTQEVSRSMTGVTAAANKTEDSAKEVLTAVSEVGTQSQALRREVQGFLDQVRVA